MLTLDPARTDFNWANARALAEVCAAVYSPPCAGGPKNFADQWIQDPFTDAHALIQTRADSIIIAFRGSKDPKDFIQDAKFDLVSYASGAKVHKGFLEDFNALRKDLIAAIAAVPKLPLIITGHSLGGALAILCADCFVSEGVLVAATFTFGQPRVGDAGFRSGYVGGPTYRVVNQNDIVPRLPGWLLGYRHCGNLIFLDCPTGWALNPPLWSTALSDALGLWSAWRRRRDVVLADHHIENYQRRMLLL